MYVGVWVCVIIVQCVWCVDCVSVRVFVPCGLAVRIPGSHPGGPGSTPGMGMDFALSSLFP